MDFLLQFLGLDNANNLNDIVIGLRKCGKDLFWIAEVFKNSGYTKEEIEAVLPVKLSIGGMPRTSLDSSQTSRQVRDTPIARLNHSDLIYQPFRVDIHHPGEISRVKESIEIIPHAYAQTINTPQPNTTQNYGNTMKIVEPLEIDNIPEELKNTDISTIVSSENNNTFKSQVKTSCSEALKKLLEEGIADKSAAISLKEQGYTAYEIVSAYIEKAVGYVKEKTVELINCAALALAGILNTKEQASEIAIEIIYQDILTSGEINIKDGKIQSSMSAIKQTASKRGIELNTYKIGIEELNTLKEPAIIHLGTLDNGHWVILSKISENTITIIDNKETKTLTLEEFKTLSSGNILTT
ncbi:MAG: hypothetical protein HY810_10075, partial [Candidatus Omnitrophica bacterium]|nr:hypothetical protein [Candidatus Omnitrophota bacterium]